jgi:hypothetical protein
MHPLLRRKSARPAPAGGGMPALHGGGTSLILAALIAATFLAALNLGSQPSSLAELPHFVAEALGPPRDDSGKSGWRTFENGISRRTSWGYQSIAYRGARPETYLTVSRHQGVRVWRWRLAAHEVGAARPVARILDASGRSIARADLSWSVMRGDDGWLVRLRLVDTNLPLPYVLEPLTTAQRGIR